MSHSLSLLSHMDNYVTIRLNNEIGELIDNHIEESKLGFSSRADFVKHALREYFKNYNGGNGNGGTHNSHLSTKKQHNGEDETNV